MRDVLRHDRSHAGAPIAAGNLHAIDGRLPHAGKSRDGLGDFSGRDVLALPAERVADAIDEIEITALVLLHKIAGAEPGVTFAEHVAQNLLVGCDLIRIAVEPVRRLLGIVQNLAEDFAGFPRCAFDAEPIRTAYRLLPFDIEANDLDAESALEPFRYATHGAAHRIEIEQGDIAFCSAVKFDDFWQT